MSMNTMDALRGVTGWTHPKPDSVVAHYDDADERCVACASTPCTCSLAS